MANYYAIVTTNYFKVNDEEEYQELFSNLICEDRIEDFTYEDDNGLVHGFGAYSCIDYLNEDRDYDFDLFIENLQELLPDDEVFIYTEVGNEKLRYVGGYTIVATNKDVWVGDLNNLASEKADEMLNRI